VGVNATLAACTPGKVTRARGDAPAAPALRSARLGYKQVRNAPSGPHLDRVAEQLAKRWAGRGRRTSTDGEVGGDGQ
jgi:hypothetical protein